MRRDQSSNIFRIIPRALLLLAAGLLLVTATGCSSKTQNVQFKINSEPEGSHVVMNVSGPERANSSDWIYLGHTPIRGVRQIREDEAQGVKITLKVMHAGYYDQVREWDGEAFWNEAVERGVIFWTPELIPHPNN
jgi:hypothetical protein